MIFDYFPRRAEPALSRLAAQFPAVVVTGPRQSGKTSLLRHLFARTHHEVDFVVEVGGQVHGVECKLTASPRPEHARGLQRFAEALPAGRRGRSLLVCLAPSPVRLAGAQVVPLARFSKVHTLQGLLLEA